MERRALIKNIAAGIVAGMAPSAAWAAGKKDEINSITELGRTILFQGDSITDAGRQRGASGPNHREGLGRGYVFHLAGMLLKDSPHKELELYNRGISGNKVFQLAERWGADCLDIKPDVLSILIGVNDFWHTLSNSYNGTAAVYERDFRKLLDNTMEKLPEVKIIIGEPFIVKGGTAITAQWYPAFKDYQEASFNIARDYNCAFVPYQAYFDQALEEAPAAFWCPDGVHPSIAGAALMAEAWYNTYRKI